MFLDIFARFLETDLLYKKIKQGGKLDDFFLTINEKLLPFKYFQNILEKKISAVFTLSGVL